MKKIIIPALLLAACMTSCCSNCDPNKCPAQTKAEEPAAVVSVDPVSYQSQNPAEMREVYDFLKACQTYYIATVDGDQPRVRPFGTINIFEGKLYIQTGHKKNVAKQIAANPKVEICAFDGKAWVRVEATLVEDTRIEAKKSMLDAYPQLRSMYDEKDENTAVYFMTNAKADFNSFGDAVRTVNF
ncbi:MAG: pyridoxamine 5'-phosphate oxidase family protein [Paludibacteraceae bacterium]|nr:pyridoxamine 5'-phosphate oxidase family protein [Paludibacteraceae bacterium]